MKIVKKYWKRCYMLTQDCYYLQTLVMSKTFREVKKSQNFLDKLSRTKTCVKVCCTYTVHIYIYTDILGYK